LWLCPFCGKKVGDNLYHLRFDHDMEDIAQFMQALERLGEDEKPRLSWPLCQNPRGLGISPTRE
jgi:hypothetical protein